MLAIFLAPVYILANVFTAYWLLRWMKEVHPLFRHPAVLGVILVLYAFFALSLLTSFLIKRDPVHRILKVISNCWLGMYLYFLGFTAILVLLRFIFAHTALTKTWLYSPMGLKAVGLGAILFVTGMCIYGMVHAVHIYTTRYEVPSKKDAHLKIALVADLHLGYSIGSHQMEEMVEKINAEEPDVVVIADQPSELTELAEAGADLDLGGHTHDGQLFPGNILTGLMWENACGMKKVGDMYSIVTSGVGLWGPPMRIGTKAEVVIIDYGK
mgnify:CR=1 FL=1